MENQITLPFFVTSEHLKFTPASYYSERYVIISETETKGLYIFSPKNLFVLTDKKGGTRASIPLNELTIDWLHRVLESEGLDIDAAAVINKIEAHKRIV